MRVLWAVLAVSTVLVFAGCAHRGPNLVCHVNVPAEYRTTPWTHPPNGEPEPVRYRVAYEAFWWNCVALRADDFDARCPFTCSGTPAASAGCQDGAEAARESIDGLIERYGGRRTQEYLRSLAQSDEAKKRMEPYFRGLPTPEGIP